MLLNLHYWLNTRTDQIFADHAQFLHGQGRTRRLFLPHKEGKVASVLLVAHVDTVQAPRLQALTNTHIFGTGLDDRLGCAMAMALRQRIPVDILLCDLEESCQSTAAHHECGDYNWILELDRAGTDVVTYDQDSDEWLELLGNIWPEIGFGSFSDICKLRTTACCANVGIGYENAHGKNSYAVLESVQMALDRVLTLYTMASECKYIQSLKPLRSRFSPFIPFEHYDMPDIGGSIVPDWLIDEEGWDNGPEYDWTLALCEDCYEANKQYVDGDIVDCEVANCDFCGQAKICNLIAEGVRSYG